jgi:hypothetical protein
MLAMVAVSYPMMSLFFNGSIGSVNKAQAIRNRIVNRRF